MATDADVIVIGAGMAGLAAGAELRRAGRDVLVVDARARVGGRVHTLHDPRVPVPIELGPELVHEGADVVHELVHQLALAEHELEGTTWLRRRGRLAERRSFDATVERGLRAAFAHIPRGGDIAFEEALARAHTSADVRELTRFFVEGFHACDPARIGARALSQGGPEGRGRSLRVHVGYRALAEGLAMRIAPCFRLGTTITSIAWRRSEVVVHGMGPTKQPVTLRARAAVVTLPLGVLQAPPDGPGAVVFDPLPGDRRRALAGLRMGHVVKLTFHFREAFWTKNAALAKAAFFFHPRGPFPTYWTSLPIQAPVLVAWAGGTAAEALEGLDEAGLAGAALDGLADLLGVPRRAVHDVVETWFMHDWTRDPLARGAYSHALVGGAGAAKRLARPEGCSLFFAGEHTAPAPDNGTVHGAIESGRRAAREALDRLAATKHAR